MSVTTAVPAAATVWPAHTTFADLLQRVADSFAADTRDHVLNVHHDVDGYRHLRMAAPDRREFWYDVTTIPGPNGEAGTLTIHGDMGTFTFSRTPDMFTFFRGATRINPSYWAQKLAGKGAEKAYSHDWFTQQVIERVEEERGDLDQDTYETLAAQVVDQVLRYADSPEEARQSLESFTHDALSFEDSWEWDLTQYTYHFLWCCHAIVAAVAAYDAATS